MKKNVAIGLFALFTAHAVYADQWTYVTTIGKNIYFVDTDSVSTIDQKGGMISAWMIQCPEGRLEECKTFDYKNALYFQNGTVKSFWYISCPEMKVSLREYIHYDSLQGAAVYEKITGGHYFSEATPGSVAAEVLMPMCSKIGKGQ